MTKVVLFGTGQGADIAYRILNSDSDHEVVGFTLDGAHIDLKELRGLPVVPFEDVVEIFPPSDYKMFSLLGYRDMNNLRKQKFQEGKDKGYEFISYCCSNIFRFEDLDVGENCFILDNQSINLDVRIGNNVVFWSSNHIGDRSVVRDHVWVSSHVTIAGNATIGESSFVGIGASIANNVTIAANSFIGASALISSDTDQDHVYVAGNNRPVSDNSRAFMKVLEASGRL